MAFNPTPQQEDAIYTKGNVLVSAAAGSGKTAVLVERVVDKLCSKEEPVSADRLLIVTFTNAAAAEMRTRIEKRLDEECRKHSDDVALSLQKHKLASAKICTIDSFCIDLVRENFDKLGVSPDFKMSDGNSLKSIDEAVLNNIIKRYLDENDPVFNELLDIIGAEYDEGNFKEFILKLYNFSRQLPFPEKWFDSLSGYYNKGEFNKNSPWWEYAFKKAELITDNAIKSISKAIDFLTVDEKAVEAYLPCFTIAAENLNKIKFGCKSENWDLLYAAINEFSLPPLPRKNLGKSFEISAAKEIYKNINTKSIEKLARIFYADNAFINEQFTKLYEPLKLLSEILKEFDSALFNEYNLQNTFTFHNTEHLALKLLCKAEGENVVMSEDAKELAEYYFEVMVDEYQDTNDLQDMLFKVLSGNEKRLFAVGDVKQSIYGFRGANPYNFLKKKNQYKPFESRNNSSSQKIILGNNFRCKPSVCEFINYFFELFMTEQTGEIVYNEEEMLIPAAKYPEISEPSCEFHVIDCHESDENSTLLEAAHIGEYIKEVMNSGAVIKENENTLRNARYSDFTILLRSAKTKAPIFAEELKRQGIPVNYNVEGFYESLEVATFLSLLSVIYNPQSDIDLLTVMMSPIFGFSAEEIAVIRSEKNSGSLYSSVILSREKGNDKVSDFLDSLQNYRYLEITNTLPKFIMILLNETGYLDIVSAMNDGARRRNNLILLHSYAEQYVAGNDRSVGGFVRYIIKQSEAGIKAAVAPSGGDTVKIMSIHASKGLQFPVCIIAGTGSYFNDNEAKESTLYSTDFGIGFKYFDEELKTKFSTVSREVILDITRMKQLEEELRLFYVALTRTQDRLLITASLPNIEKKLDSLKVLLAASEGKIDSSVFLSTKSYCDWMLLALLLHPCGKALRDTGHNLILNETQSKIEIEIISPEEISIENETEDEEIFLIDEKLSENIQRNISYKYPFDDILNVEAKASVSKLANSAESSKYAFGFKPAFMQSGGITPAERGTAMHKVMQYFDFSKSDNVREELDRLYEWQYLSEREYEAINVEALDKFFKSRVFERIKKSSRVDREFKFLTEIPAQKIAPELAEKLQDENIIVQGAVDVCFIEDNEIVVLDFKTDRVDNLSVLAETYGEQLTIYASALTKIFELPVKEKIIYSFSLSEEIEV